MWLPALSLLAQADPRFVPAPGHERTEIPGATSMSVVWDGAYRYATSGVMTLLVFPVLAVVLYRMGFRVAGPLLGLFVLGLFLARILGAPA